MTPQSIREISQVRDEFYTSFARTLNIPTKITKGNSYSSSFPKVSWLDASQRANYICVYAHLAPDSLIPERPLILRLGVNQGLGIDASGRAQKHQGDRQRLLQFDLTLLPGELLMFVPWVTGLFMSHEQNDQPSMVPPSPLNRDTLDQILQHGAWTQQAIRSLEGQGMVHQELAMSKR